jgi:hypothetical protein
VGQFPIFTQQISAIPGNVSYGGITASLANVYDVNVRSDVTTVLDSPVAQLPVYNVDPSSNSVTPVPSLNLPDINGGGVKARDLIEIVNPSDVTTGFFSLPVISHFNNVAAALRIPRTKVGNATPTVRIHVSLATYCGDLRTHTVAGSDTPFTAHGQNLLIRPARTVLDYIPRVLSASPTTGQAFFDTSLNGKFNLEEQFKPTRSNCRLKIDDYAAYFRSWGKVENNYIFWSESHSWDDTSIDNESNHTLKCHFEKPDPSQPQSVQDEVEGFNQMAINEVLAQFIQANAKQPMPVPARVSDDQLKSFKDKFPRDTWAPTMMAICGGEPICDIAGIILDNVGTAVQSSSTSVTRTGHVDVSLDTSSVYMGMVPHFFSTQVRFDIKH